MASRYVVVRYRQLIPSGFGPGEDVRWFDDYASAQRCVEDRQDTHPAYWWRVETRRYGDGPTG